MAIDIDMDDYGTRQERREDKQRRKRNKVLKHGRSFIEAYKNAVLKRINKRKKKRGY